MKTQGTQTSSFGAPAKINHNSAKFYNSRLYENFGQQVLKIYRIHFVFFNYDPKRKKIVLPNGFYLKKKTPRP